MRTRREGSEKLERRRKGIRKEGSGKQESRGWKPQEKGWEPGEMGVGTKRELFPTGSQVIGEALF